MGSEEHKEMLVWTKEEYKKFSDEMMDKPVSFYAFEMLYWCGIDVYKRQVQTGEMKVRAKLPMFSQMTVTL